MLNTLDLQATTFAEGVAKVCGALEAFDHAEIHTINLEMFIHQGFGVQEFALAVLEMLTENNAELHNVPNEGTPVELAKVLEAETLVYTLGEWFDTGMQHIRFTTTKPEGKTCLMEVAPTNWQ
jgi:hypothetical protein